MDENTSATPATPIKAGPFNKAVQKKGGASVLPTLEITPDGYLTVSFKLESLEAAIRPSSAGKETGFNTIPAAYVDPQTGQKTQFRFGWVGVANLG